MAANTNKTWSDLTEASYLTGYVSHYDPGMMWGLSPALFNMAGARPTVTNTVKIRDYSFKTSDSTGTHTAVNGPAAKVKKNSQGRQLIKVFRVKRRYDFDEEELEFAKDISAIIGPQDMDSIQFELGNLKTEYMQVYNDDAFDALDGTITLTETPGTYGTISFGTIQSFTPAAQGWSDPNATIITDIAAMKTTFEATAKKRIKTMIMNSTVVGYILSNTGVKGFKDYTDLNQQYINTGTIQRFMGIDIMEVNSVYYKDSSTKHIPNNTIRILGDDPNILGFVKGYGTIPNANKEGFTHVAGEYAYAVIDEDPIQLGIIAGLNAFPIMYKPELVGKFTW